MAQILIVDDAMDIIQVLAFILKKQGHTITTAVSGLQALEKAGQIEGLELAFVDFNLPDMTGIQLTAQLREQVKGIKVIMLSGQEGVDLAALGVDAFMPKPFTSDQIKKKLEGIL